MSREVACSPCLTVMRTIYKELPANQDTIVLWHLPTMLILSCLLQGGVSAVTQEDESASAGPLGIITIEDVIEELLQQVHTYLCPPFSPLWVRDVSRVFLRMNICGCVHNRETFNIIGKALEWSIK